MLRLKELRIRDKITQKELATKLNLSQQTISGYENGTRVPDQTTLELLANFFKVSLDYLTYRIDKDNTNDSTTSIENFEIERLCNMINTFSRENINHVIKYAEFIDWQTRKIK